MMTYEQRLRERLAGKYSTSTPAEARSLEEQIRTASRLGKTVALVDDHLEIGGAGVNTGTVPSKTLRETALALSGFRSRNLYGVDLSLRREVTVPDFLGHQEHVKHAFHWSFTQQLEGLNAMMYHGRCSFLDAHTVQIGPVPEVGVKDAAVPDRQIQLRGEKNPHRHRFLAGSSGRFSFRLRRNL